MKGFPFFKQLNNEDSATSCILAIAKYYGKALAYEDVNRNVDKRNISLDQVGKVGETIGLKSILARVSFEKLAHDTPLPCIIEMRNHHFVVVYKVKRNAVHISDPGFGLIKYNRQEFITELSSVHSQNSEGISILLLEPTPAFFKQKDAEKVNKVALSFFFSYLLPYKKYFVQIFLGMIYGAALQLIFPFLTQSIVDVGIQNQDISFINLILIAQMMLVFSRIAVDFIRSWIMLHISTRINISIVSDFLVKLLKLPISFFEKRSVGDLLQRMGDHRRIQNFMSTTSLGTIFSIVSLFVFSFVLSLYSTKILLIFFGGSILYVGWILIFLKKRRELDYKYFHRSSASQNTVIQLLQGVREIKLNGCERSKRWEWEGLQARLFEMNIQSLKLNQVQQVGASVINEFKNILIAITSAKLVIGGEMSLGMMLSVQYIIGQLSSPIGQLIGLVNTYQDAKISLDRLNEIHEVQEEQSPQEILIDQSPDRFQISFERISFSYNSEKGQEVLKDINLNVEPGQFIAIVGSSGSGKTTLLKLLLKVYNPSSGRILVDGLDIRNIENERWRGFCGAAFPDGFIFSDSIAKNISLSDERVDYKKLVNACKTANIQEYVESLPERYDTRIGSDGHGLSQGQRQRLLIARAVYKEPELIVFDEATSALDSNNEVSVMGNIRNHFKGKTLLVTAHRLSTIRDADQIVVMENGGIQEIGTHDVLITQEGCYYNLVKNQLDRKQIIKPD